MPRPLLSLALAAPMLAIGCLTAAPAMAQAPNQKPAPASSASALQPPPLAGAIGPPITFDTHDEYLRAHETQRQVLDPEEIARLRDRAYIAAHPYNTNPFVKRQYCRLSKDEKKLAYI